ncbi:MAG TPA: hypothetical protein VE198_18555 [Actinoallomurus sp.]|nr:hypothetical protein [Actinoallomurus sp.]
MTAPTPNAELAYRVLDAIDADPDSWDQGTWASRVGCRTSACFAGWACLLSGDNPQFHIGEADTEHFMRGEERHYAPVRAAQLLGVPTEMVFDRTGSTDGPLLFNACNTREDLGRLVGEIFGPRPEAAS